MKNDNSNNSVWRHSDMKSKLRVRECHMRYFNDCEWRTNVLFQCHLTDTVNPRSKTHDKKVIWESTLNSD